MARRRYVSTTISQDTRVNKLAVQYGDFATLLYTWMIPHAADDATLPGDPEELLYQVLPGRRDKSPEDVQAALDGMAALGLIFPTGEGGIMFPPVAFYKYQPYIKEDRRGGEPAAEPRESAQGAPPPTPRADSGANPRKSAQKSASPSLTSSPSVSPSPSHSDMGDVLRPVPPTVAQSGGAAAPRHTPPAPTVLHPAPKPKDAPPVERPRDLLFEAVCDACLIDWHQLTDTERGRVNHATAQIRKAGGTTETIPVHAANYRLHFTTPLTPMALAGNWSLCANAPPAAAARAPTGRRRTVEEANLAEYERIKALENGHEPDPFPEALDADWHSNEQGAGPRALRPVVAEVRRAPR